MSLRCPIRGDTIDDPALVKQYRKAYASFVASLKDAPTARAS
ncbi:hypothetical protein [Streptomyces sp. NPDC000880]